MFASNENEIGGCTSFAAVGSATQDGLSIVAQTVDERVDEVFVLSTLANLGHYRFMAVNVTYPERYPNVPHVYHGLNEKGLALLTTAVPTVYSLNGWNYVQHIVEILENAATPDEAYRILTQNLKSHGLHDYGRTWTFSNATHVMAVETTNGVVAIVKSFTDGFIVQTNHFNVLTQYDEWIPSSSPTRFRRATDLIRGNYGKLNPSIAMQIVRDRANGVNAICNRGSTDKDGKELGTLASSIMLPSNTKPTMWTALGNPPCANEFVQRTIEPSGAPASATPAIAISMLPNLKDEASFMPTTSEAVIMQTLGDYSVVIGVAVTSVVMLTTLTRLFRKWLST